jgi:sulfite reductase beta subunit-like hemoprotein
MLACDMPTEAPPLWRQKFDVERVKREGLDVDLERLERDGYDALTPEEFYRLKTWGVCSQRTPGLHMIRIRVPGGRIGSGQLRGIGALSGEVADGSAHITTRQNLELHSVPSERVRDALDGVAHLGLTTRSACGHAVRNIVGCTLAGICADEVLDIRPTVQALHEFFLSRAEHYNARLPRRLNVYVAGCATCMAHAQVNDLGFVGTRVGGRVGFQLWCAGSLGSNPRLAHLLFGFVPEEEVCAVAEAVTDVYCAHGFRDRPAKARLKFLVDEWGPARFAETVRARLAEIRPATQVRTNGALPVVGPDRRRRGEHDGVLPQRQPGYVRIEARVPLGDLTGAQMDVLASLADASGDGAVYLTRQQNAELHWVHTDQAQAVVEALAEGGLRPRGAGSLVDVQVCAGTEWCIWGVADSRGLARDIEGALGALVDATPDAEPLRVHISGCSHGCAQHQVADVGLAAVGVRDTEGAGEGFEVYGGGRLGRDPVAARRLGKVPFDATSSTVIDMLRGYIADRLPGEDVPAFLDRTGRRAVQEQITSEKERVR